MIKAALERVFMKYISNSREDTLKIAKEFAKSVKKGDIICLNGDLGAGKTAFVSGFSKGLGFDGYVSSPTFALINEYNGEIPIYHFDVYRIGECEEMFEIGLDEYLFGDGVCVIEWAERIKELLPDNIVNVDIIKNESLGEDYREIYIDGGEEN